MFSFTRSGPGRFVFAFLLTILAAIPAASAASSAGQIDRDASAALARLYREVPAARQLSRKAKAVLVFPSVIKGGLVLGGQYGEGVLRQGRRTIGYYNIAAASYGLQAGAQSFGYALFFMNDAALSYLEKSDGWEVGVGPSVVLVDEGMAKTITTATVRDAIYAFVFGQKGLMAGIGLQGSKITRINPPE